MRSLLIPRYRNSLRYKCTLHHHPRTHPILKANLASYHASTKNERSEESPPFAVLSVIFFGSLPIIIAAYYLYTENKNQASNTGTFTPYLIESKQSHSPTSSIFELGSPSQASSDSHEEIWKKGIWSVEFKQPQLQIARSYTPLPPTLARHLGGTSNVKIDCLRFFIRHSGYGEVSNYLHKRNIQQSVDIRGPYLEYELPKDVNEVFFLAGGTGIAPALQAIYTFFEARKSSDAAIPKVHILWANRGREECVGGISDNKSSKGLSRGRVVRSPLPYANLDYSGPQSPLVEWITLMRKKYPNHISIDYFIDEEQSFIDANTLNSYLGYRRHHNELCQKDRSQLNIDLHNHYPPPFPPFHQRSCGRKLIIVSGPDGFINYLAGPKQWENGQEKQGELGGLLGRVDTKGWEVRKL